MTANQYDTSNIENTYVKPSDAELLVIFPEAKQIVPALLKEFQQQRRELVEKIEVELRDINAESSNESYRYYWRSWLKLTLGEELQSIDRHITRLSRQLRIIKGTPTPKGALTDDMIQAAREVPVESLFDQQFRRSGHNLVGLCEFHDENTPSFHIYVEENRGWCFGCNQGGNTIDVYMLLQDCDFKEAVLALTGGQR
jgi:DNA primase